MSFHAKAPVRIDFAGGWSDVPEFADAVQQPSCEALAALFFGRIAGRLPAGVSLTRVRVSEDLTLHADCTGLP